MKCDLIEHAYGISFVRPGANKGKSGEGEEEHSSLDIDQDHEEDSRRSREINIDMQADRRDSFEVARISSPEVSSLSETVKMV